MRRPRRSLLCARASAGRLSVEKSSFPQTVWAATVLAWLSVAPSRRQTPAGSSAANPPSRRNLVDIVCANSLDAAQEAVNLFTQLLVAWFNVVEERDWRARPGDAVRVAQHSTKQH